MTCTRSHMLWQRSFWLMSHFGSCMSWICWESGPVSQDACHSWFESLWEVQKRCDSLALLCRPCRHGSGVVTSPSMPNCLQSLLSITKKWMHRSVVCQGRWGRWWVILSPGTGQVVRWSPQIVESRSLDVDVDGGQQWVEISKHETFWRA